MKQLFSAFTVAILTIAGSAQAETSIDWSGAYAGVSLARSAGEHHYSYSYYNGSDGDYELNKATDLGLHVGYRLDQGNYVLGAELAYTKLGTAEAGWPDYHYDKLLDLKLSAGYKIGSALTYLTVGASAAKFDSDGPKDTVKGGLVGLGIAYALTDKFTIGGEFNVRELTGDEIDEYKDFKAHVKTFELRASYNF